MSVREMKMNDTVCNAHDVGCRMLPTMLVRSIYGMYEISWLLCSVGACDVWYVSNTDAIYETGVQRKASICPLPRKEIESLWNGPQEKGIKRIVSSHTLFINDYIANTHYKLDSFR